ncbi:MAG: hypothetical protein JKY56_13035, partial [Kofleriaceae bacterium]|nr:hypothetical protein [Kofleriaceae bacterium]
VLAGNRIIVETRKIGARKQFRTFSTKWGTLSQIDTTPASKQHYIGNWATGSKTLAYVAHHYKNNSVRRTLFIHAEKLVKARLPDDWRGVSIMWPSKDGDRYLIGSDYQLGLWNQQGKRLWSWSPPDGQKLASANFTPDGSIIASAGLRIYRIKDGKGEVLLRVKGRHPERPHRKLMNVDNHSFKAYSFVDHPILMDSGKIGYSLVHVANIRYH